MCTVLLPPGDNPIAVNKYRVIHKSVKHFKNSQQTDYATDHGNTYVDRESTVEVLFKENRVHMLP